LEQEAVMKFERVAQAAITLIVVLALVLLWWGGGAQSPPLEDRSMSAPEARTTVPVQPASSPLADSTRASTNDEARLVAEASVRVRVTDDVGAPIAGSEVQFMRLHDRELVPAASAVRTADDGVALVRAVEADAVVSRADGYATALVRSPQAGSAYELRMLRGARVRVRFLDQSGSPVAGIGVRAWQRSPASEGDDRVDVDATGQPSPMVLDVRDVIATAITDEVGVADLGTLLGGSWSWKPTDPSVAVLETTIDGVASFQLEPGADLSFDVTIGTVRAAVVRVSGDQVVSAVWRERAGPRVARSSRAVQRVELVLARRYPGGLVIAAVPMPVPDGVDLEHRSMDLILVLADRGTVTKEIPLLPVADLRPFDLSVAELPVTQVSPRVEVRMFDARGLRIDGLELDLMSRSRGRGLQVETGRVQPIPVGRYRVASIRHKALAKPLKAVGEFSIDERATELELRLPVEVYVRRLEVIGADGRTPGSMVVTLMQGDRSLGQRFLTEPRDVTVVATERSSFVRVESFGYQEAEVHGLTERPERIEVVLDRTR
jgi:protocatechuate 3,4-dioxygenase beta subunit